jgi:2-oxo-4-hydroxy-4-carboxy-5-ureidoimidazoline decarboxylase
MTLDALNELPPADAETAFLSCCGARAWARKMTTARPFATTAALHAAAERIWWSLDAAAWREAFAAHPRIGDRKTTSAWSAREQAGATAAAETTQVKLAQVNAAYEARFGYIFIVCATGKSGDEMVAIATRRLDNDPDTEIRVAAAEQAAITRLRIDKLLVS